jgi:hypothetical protein
MEPRARVADRLQLLGRRARLSAGAGIYANIGDTQGSLDYAFTNGGSLGAVNRLSLGVRF